MQDLNTQQLTTILGGFIQHAKINFNACALEDYDRNIIALQAIASLAVGTAQTIPQTRYALRALSVFGAIAEIAPELSIDSDPERDHVWEMLDTWEDHLRELHQAYRS